MKMRKLEVTITGTIEILNKENFEDFTNEEKAKLLIDVAFGSSAWPMEGIGFIADGFKVNKQEDVEEE